MLPRVDGRIAEKWPQELHVGSFELRTRCHDIRHEQAGYGRRREPSVTVLVAVLRSEDLDLPCVWEAEVGEPGLIMVGP